MFAIVHADGEIFARPLDRREETHRGQGLRRRRGRMIRYARERRLSVADDRQKTAIPQRRKVDEAILADHPCPRAGDRVISSDFHHAPSWCTNSAHTSIPCHWYVKHQTHTTTPVFQPCYFLSVRG